MPTAEDPAATSSMAGGFSDEVGAPAEPITVDYAEGLPSPPSAIMAEVAIGAASSGSSSCAMPSAEDYATAEEREGKGASASTMPSFDSAPAPPPAPPPPSVQGPGGSDHESLGGSSAMTPTLECGEASGGGLSRHVRISVSPALPRAAPHRRCRARIPQRKSSILSGEEKYPQTWPEPWPIVLVRHAACLQATGGTPHCRSATQERES
mmetsp:Transcript_23149/g.72789  ORF Transcript_23149/g.72789 Transcript_23149/m.72789 type:complete len:209 (+) Transcript_23149:753-1379(+)